MNAKKIALPLIVLLIQIHFINAQDTLNKNVDGAVITFKEQMVDVGEMIEGDSLNYVFKFTNTGDKDLIIQKVITTCSCTTTESPKDPIAPGKSGEIKVTFDSNKQEKTGRQNKVITILSNAINNPERVILNFNILKKGK